MSRVFRGLRIAVSALALVAAGTADAEVALEPLWTVGGFERPESVLYDAERQQLYVSNVNGAPPAKDGNGYISRLNLAGDVLESHWVEGLDGPKGMALVGERLYVSDIDQLVEIDVAEGKVAARYPAPHAKFLNDVSAAQDGAVYVSDMMDNTIYWLAGGVFSVWVRDPALESPNGLLVEPHRLVFGSWGDRTQGFDTNRPGFLKTIDYGTREIAPLGAAEPFAHCDGVEPDGEGAYFVSDWKAGKVFHVTADGRATPVLELKQGSADIEHIVERDTLLVPRMLEGKVSAYTVKHGE